MWTSPPQRVYLVPKLSRSQFSPERPTQDTKLNRQKIHWIIRQKQKGVASNEVAKDMKVTVRRVEQIREAFPGLWARTDR